MRLLSNLSRRHQDPGTRGSGLSRASACPLPPGTSFPGPVRLPGLPPAPWPVGWSHRCGFGLSRFCPWGWWPTCPRLGDTFGLCPQGRPFPGGVLDTGHSRSRLISVPCHQACSCGSTLRGPSRASPAQPKGLRPAHFPPEALPGGAPPWSLALRCPAESRAPGARARDWPLLQHLLPILC